MNTPRERWQSARDRHSDDLNPPRLPIAIPVDRLADEQHCEQLMQDLEDAAADGWAWDRRPAHRRTHEHLPTLPGLYVFVWNPTFEFRFTDGNVRAPFVLYVGRAGGPDSQNTLKGRYRAQYSRIVGGDPEGFWHDIGVLDRNKRLTLYLSLHPLEFWYLVVDDVDTLPELEKRLTTLYSPPLNRTGGPRLRPVGIVRAFKEKT